MTFFSPGINGRGSALNTNQTGLRYMRISDYYNLTYTSFTVQMWFYATFLSSYDDGLFSQSEQLTSRRSLHYLVRNSRLHMGFFSDDTPGRTTIMANRWYHAAFVYNYSALEQTVYLNGLEDGRSSPQGPYLGSSGSLNIGMSRVRTAGEECFTG